MNRSDVRTLLQSAGIRPAKRLGQNFLVDRAALDRVDATVAGAIAERGIDTIVEIGPGLGAVTERLLGHGLDVLAIEVDRRLAAILQDRLGTQPALVVRRDDVLRVDLTAELAGCRALVVGSLPYRITAPILKHLVAHRAAIVEALLITQREVADKLADSPGKDGSSLGVLVKAYADVDVVGGIGRNGFYPAPDVDSTLWRLRFLGHPRFEADEGAFFTVVRALYGVRRKMIRRALQEIVAKERIDDMLAAAEVDGTWRGERLSFEELDRLAAAFRAATDA